MTCYPGNCKCDKPKGHRYLDILFGIRPNKRLGRLGAGATDDYLPHSDLVVLADRYHKQGTVEMRVERIKLDPQATNVLATFKYAPPTPTSGSFHRYSG